MRIKFSLLIVIIVSLFSFIALHYKHNTNLPIIAVANYGPHSSLEESIAGMKAELTQLGFIEGKNIKYLISDVNFDLSLIPQMISTLKHKKPAIMVVIATPIAQFAKHAIKNIPLVFNAITDPVTVGLLKKPNSSFDNITGASDKQNLQVLLTFAKQILHNATRVGVLYATAEANDLALIKMLKKAANKMHMQVIAIPIDEPRDISIRMQMLKHKADFLYVGTSGAIQPTLPTIVANAKKMHLPIFNADAAAVKNHQVLASFSVDYYKIGINVGKIIARLLQGEPITNIQPYYPSLHDHHGFISKKQLEIFGLQLPTDLTNITVVE